MKTSERDIEKACSDLLALDNWRCLKTDPVSRREWAKGFGEKGMADCLYLRYGLSMLAPITPESTAVCPRSVINPVLAQSQILWIEWKTPKGRIAVHQHAWHDAERRRGALTLIAGIDFPATIEGFVSWYQRSGLMRRSIKVQGAA